MNVTIRDVNEVVFRKFKAKAVEEGLKLGEALTQAMALWIKHREFRPKRSLLDFKPFDWGKGNERISLDIDKIMYGERT